MYPHFYVQQYFVPAWQFRDKAFKKEIKTFQININMWVRFKQDHPHKYYKAGYFNKIIAL